jgi:DNA repair exonuclease SbcCD ATPase subunit
MRVLGALILFFPAAFLNAAEPPVYVPGPEIKTLSAAMESCVQGLNSVQTTPVEAARATLLKKSIDQLTDAASRAAEAGRVLSADAQKPAAIVAVVVQGKGSVESLDHRYETAVGSARALRRQWTGLGEEAERIHSSLEDAESKKPQGQDSRKQREATEALARKKEAIEGAQGRLAGEDRALKDVEELLESLKEAASSAKRDANGIGRAASELETASRGLSGTSTLLQEAGAQAKQKIDALGAPPESEARTRVYQKLEPLIDGQRSISSSGDTARNRAGSFSDGYSSFLKNWRSFEAIHKDAGGRLAGIAGVLTGIAAALPELKP